MRKDHEDQIQHLKRLKNDEIDVVKSATSQARYVGFFFPLLLFKTTQINMFLLFFAPHPPPQVSHSCHRADGAVLLSPRRALLFLGDAGPPGGAAESRGGGEGVLEGHHLQDAHAAQRAGEAAGEGEDGTGVAAVPSSAAAARWKTHKPVFFFSVP